MYYKKKNPHGGATEKSIIDFSASVNPLGAPSSVIEAAKEALDKIDRYPDPYAEDLVKAIATYEGVPSDYIICGNGASEIIYSYCAAQGPKRALEIAPTFSEYEEAERLSGGEMLYYTCKESDLAAGDGVAASDDFVPRDDFFDCLAEVKPSIVFICNPNNPTGKLYSKEFIEKVLIKAKALGARVFIDECFMDLSNGIWSSKEFLKEYPNLFILKAFTKTFAMPGLRLGYGLCSDENLLAKMSEITPPWNISSVAQAAGIAATRETEYIKKAKELVADERAYLIKELSALGFKTASSGANFILFYDSRNTRRAYGGELSNRAGDKELNASADHVDGEKDQSAGGTEQPNREDGGKGPADIDLRAHLLQKGIAIRDCANFPGLTEGWYRIAIKNHEDNQKLIDALGSIDTAVLL
ncbi:MAG: aminotransferase class I/II-fold pyridoxal phosphate-dependent enzyme [Firmicutes bacterium]|nr:aminotransferase class I/II-fold pyridoxal phosphate-dependent enzyme [Bacillota bacterium]